MTIADVLEALQIPARRIRLNPPPGTATEQDVIDVHDRGNRLCELVDGVLLEKTAGYYESLLAVVLARLLGDFAEQHELGPVAGADGMMRLAPGLVRIPDVSFIPWTKLPGGKSHSSRFLIWLQTWRWRCSAPETPPPRWNARSASISQPGRDSYGCWIIDRGP